jgi:hypothetical protein
VGLLFYGSDPKPAEIPDRVLAHLKLVATTKLRRGESFTVTWHHPTELNEGRTSIWVQPAIPLRFVFDESESAPLDSEYLQELSNAANSTNGMYLDLEEERDRTGPTAVVPV